MSGYVCQADECPDYKLVEAAELLLLATRPDHPASASACRLLIELVQTARAASLRDGPAWSVDSRVDLWLALRQSMDAHVRTHQPDVKAHSDLQDTLEAFQQDINRHRYPPDSGARVRLELGVSRSEPLLTRTAIRAVAALKGPPARRHLGICHALSLLLAAEAREWTWPEEGGSSRFGLMMLDSVLLPLAFDLAREQAGLAPRSTTRIGRRIDDLTDLLPTCKASEFGMGVK
jgi:hypothetical protein